MTISIKVKTAENREVKYLKAECGVRYWEDAEVNGVDDENGTLIPFRDGEAWCPVIELSTGRVCDWPEGTTADIHYKVCDDGMYFLLDADRNEVVSIDGYVPTIMCPEGNGYGDYVIMKIGPDGTINNWSILLDAFEEPQP